MRLGLRFKKTILLLEIDRGWLSEKGAEFNMEQVTSEALTGPSPWRFPGGLRNVKLQKQELVQETNCLF